MSKSIGNADMDFSIVQYAVDTLLFVKADAREIFCLNAVLNTFPWSTGFKVNYHNSSMIPLNVPKDKSGSLADLLGSRVERRFSSTARFMTYGGRLTHVNSVL